ncbi:hypothetical protein S40288_07461 [Stachybotrys chartarum IBT 40288]|nr:hypothetical protein S40288_07461 [Stachybotrys chartarum IBT 40288]
MSARDRDPSPRTAAAPSSPPAGAGATATRSSSVSASLPSPAVNPAEADPRPALDDVGNGDDHDVHDDQSPPKQFEPLFTLLTNTTTNSTVHPHVHYLFSDDDAASVLAAQDPSSSSPSARSLIVDLAPSAAGGWAVSWASSLTPDFAVTGTEVEVSGGDGGALMLRVDGVEREPVEPNIAAGAASLRSSGSGSGVQATREDVDALLEEFRRRMGVLNKVVGQGEKRCAAVGKDRAEHDVERDDNADESGREDGEEVN